MSYPVEVQVFFVIAWLLVVLFLQISLLPYLNWLGNPFRIPVSFATSLLIFSLISWYLSLSGLPVQAALIPFILLLLGAWYLRLFSLSSLATDKKWYISFLAIFVAFLLFKVIINPFIDVSFEKYTDQMYLASMMLNTHVPPSDVWYAGGMLTWYYYLSQWPYACLGIITGIPSFIVYNLVIPTVFSVSSLMLYALSSWYTNRYRHLILGTIFISYPALYLIIIPMIQMNLPLQVLLNQTLRIIPGSITENPLTALFIGSPRAYALGMMNQMLVLILIFFLYTRFNTLGRREQTAYYGLCILGLGSMIPMHTWDAIIYFALFIVSGLIFCYCRVKNELGTGTPLKIAEILNTFKINPGLCTRICFLVPIGAVLLYLPFHLMMDKTGMKGVAWNPVPSDPILFSLTFGFFILVLSLLMVPVYRKSPSLLLIAAIPAIFGFVSVSLILIPLLGILFSRRVSPVHITASAGLCSLIFCEFFSFIDASGIDRMNTTYKFYFVAWILLSVAVWIRIGEVLDQKARNIGPGWCEKALYLLTIGMIFFTPLLIVTVSHEGLNSLTLDGSSWIESKIMPEEMHAIQYLRTLPPGEVIVEGVSTQAGDTDSVDKYFSRISTFTGISSVLGSYTREKLYRNQTPLDERVGDIAGIYQNPEQADAIMKKYGATLLYTGYPEYSWYQITDPGAFARAGFIPVWNEGITVLWRPPYLR